MVNAEQRLDILWEKVDQSVSRSWVSTLDELVKHLFTSARQIERTPVWLDPIAVRKSSTANKSTALQEDFAYLRLGSLAPDKFTPAQSKTKPKTRGTACSTSDESMEPVVTPKADSQPTITLNSRAFKVFRVLFHQPSLNDLPEEVSWVDFLYAMAATGFAPEKLYGSIWQFTPTKLDIERGIQFHEPHPAVKIPFRNARRIGRRLNRAYEWHGGMFVLDN